MCTCITFDNLSFISYSSVYLPCSLYWQDSSNLLVGRGHIVKVRACVHHYNYTQIFFWYIYILIHVREMFLLHLSFPLVPWTKVVDSIFIFSTYVHVYSFWRIYCLYIYVCTITSLLVLCIHAQYT